MRFGAAEGLGDTDIHFAMVSEGQDYLIEKPDPEIDLDAVA